MSVLKKYASPLSFIIIIVTIYWSIHTQKPQKISNLNTPETEFSSERALVHLKKISQKPHYVGSENHKEVRNYIVNELEKLDLTVAVQNQIAVNRKWRSGTNTQNIIARIKGSQNKKALLLLSHYDSNPHSSLGASDAGTGVVTILEGIRAFLANNPSPKNDIIILISDAEELGLLGANAFVKHHPWAKDVGLVLNFEARGSGGPSYILMETNEGNKNLVQAFNKASPKYPVGNSLLYSIYKMLPNDTDLTVFREDGNIKGFNFAFLDDHFDYHTAQDSYARLDKNTLQHQADYLMPLLAYFSNADLESLDTNQDQVFLNFPGFNLINYPFSWVTPMLIISTALFFLLMIIGLKRKKLKFKSIIIGFIPFLIALSVSGIFTFYGWKLLLKIHPQYNDILHGFTYNGYYYMNAFISLSIWLTLAMYHKYLKNHLSINLLVAPIFIWLLINFLISMYLPGAGFFIIPVFIALIILAVQLFTKDDQTQKIIFFTVLVIPMIIIFAPLIPIFPVGLGLKMIAISSVLTVLTLSLFIPIFSSYKQLRKIAQLFLLIGVLLLISASFSSGYSINNRKPNSILYIFDADRQEAFWASYNAKTDEFTKQFLENNPTQGSFINNPSASKYSTNFKLYKKTELIDIKQPRVEIIKDSIVGSDRIIHLQIIPQRKVNRLELLSNSALHFKTFILNGEELSLKKNQEYLFTTEKIKHILSYYFTSNNEVLDLQFSIPKEEIPELEFYEASYNLFNPIILKKLKINFIPRNEIMMPMPFVLNDAVVIKKKIDL